MLLNLIYIYIETNNNDTTPDKPISHVLILKINIRPTTWFVKSLFSEAYTTPEY